MSDGHEARMDEQRKRLESIPQRIREVARADDLVAAYMRLLLSTGRWDPEAATQLIVAMAQRHAELFKMMVDLSSLTMPPMIVKLPEVAP